MGSSLSILMKVQRNTSVVLIFKMSLENPSARHPSALSVTFLF